MKKYVYIIPVMLCTFILSGCGHEHVYANATCTTPKTCTECGETEGNALDHMFLEATCESPERCERCGETRGNALGHNFTEPTCETSQICEICKFIGQEALGHTTEVGKCTRCNLYQGEDIINSISKKLKYADDITELAFMVQMTNADYNSILNGLTYYESAKKEYESALELCGNYSDLSTLKKDIQNVIDSLPLASPENNENSILSYLDSLKNFIAIQAKCQITMITVKDSIK